MQFQHLAVGLAGALVQSVDVLRQHPDRDAGLVEAGQRVMVRVRLGVARRVVDVGLPEPGPGRRVAQVGVEGERVRGVRVAGPHPVWSPVVGNPGAGGDAGPGHQRGPAGPDPVLYPDIAQAGDLRRALQDQFDAAGLI